VSEIVRLAIVCFVPISIMGMSAFLIYKQADGWGWFLLVALCIVGSFRESVN
jgi:uncharacterized membrane protein YeaQ/YmgE (transglycosylase-associated protein family)